MSTYFYNTPTKIIFGKGAELQVGELVKTCGYKKILIHYGGGSAKRTGLLDRIKASLDSAGIAHADLGGAQPNPRLKLVYEGIELARREKAEMILAVGGGSVIDSSKALGYGAANDGDVWDFYSSKRQPTACLPIAAVLTIAASGSEMSNASVITNTDSGLKRTCYSEMSRPVFAVMNPELTMTLPDYQTASGCVDIIMHTMERFFGGGDNMALTDNISTALIRTVMKNALILRDKPNNYDARAEVMWAGSLSHNGLTSFGTDGGDWTSHKLEHELGGKYDVAHGAGLSAVWGSWARYVCSARLDRFVKFAVEIMEITPGGSDEETAERGIRAMEDFFRSISMPVSITELGFSPSNDEIEEMAKKCYSGVGGKLGTLKRLTQADAAAILKAAL